MAEDIITIFGTWWCGHCSWVRRFCDKNKIPYKWVDIDQDKSGEEFVVATNNGMRSVPTIVFLDGSILVEPTDSELTLKLGAVFPGS
jgi:glutaredoxin